MGSNGGPKHQVETVESSPGSKDGSGRPMAPVVTRVDTDPSQANARQKETSVRHVQDPPPFNIRNGQNVPPNQKWQSQELEPPHHYPQRNGTPDSQNDSARREYRNSGWGRPRNGSVGVGGAM